MHGRLYGIPQREAVVHIFPDAVVEIAVVMHRAAVLKEGGFRAVVDVVELHRDLQMGRRYGEGIRQAQLLPLRPGFPAVVEYVESWRRDRDPRGSVEKVPWNDGAIEHAGIKEHAKGHVEVYRALMFREDEALVPDAVGHVVSRIAEQYILNGVELGLSCRNGCAGQRLCQRDEILGIGEEGAKNSVLVDPFRFFHGIASLC